MQCIYLVSTIIVSEYLIICIYLNNNQVSIVSKMYKSTKPTLLSLDTDTFAYICQYLTIYELLRELQRVNKCLYDRINETPQCVIALTNTYCLHKWKSLSQVTDRLSCVKQLCLPKTTDFETIRKKWFIDVATHCNNLSIDIDSIDSWLYHDLKCQSLINLTVSASKGANIDSDKILEFLKHIQCHLPLLSQLILKGINMALSPTFIGDLFQLRLHKLSILTGNKSWKDSYFIFDPIESTLCYAQDSELWNHLRYLSYNKGRNNIKCDINYSRETVKENITILCYHAMKYCKKLKHLELRNLNQFDYIKLFGNDSNNIEIISEELNKIIVHISSSKIDHLFLYLSRLNIKLELMDLLLYDKYSEQIFHFNATNILENFKHLLQAQLSGGGSLLRDINLKIESQCSKYDEVMKWHQIQILYETLADALINCNTRYRKELNIRINVQYNAASWISKERKLQIDSIIKLLRALDKNIECWTFILSISMHKIKFLKAAEFEAFIYELESNHLWQVTTINQYDTSSEQYRRYKITNLLKQGKTIFTENDKVVCFMHYAYDYGLCYECVEEIRLNDDGLSIQGMANNKKKICLDDINNFNCYPMLIIDEDELKSEKEDKNNDDDFNWGWSFDIDDDNDNNNGGGDINSIFSNSQWTFHSTTLK